MCGDHEDDRGWHCRVYSSKQRGGHTYINDQYEIEGEELLARCICHELDHLDGHLYVEKVEGALHDVTYEDTQE